MLPRSSSLQGSEALKWGAGRGLGGPCSVGMRVGQDRASAQLWLGSCLLSRDSQWAHPWALDEFSQCTESWLLGSQCGGGGLVAAAVRVLSSALHLGAWRNRLILPQVQWASRRSNSPVAAWSQ